MADISIEIIKVARPIHWIKNFALFAALIFSGGLFTESLLARMFIAFIAFSLATSAAYTFNDIFDAKLDKLHPTKKKRPIASGRLPKTVAYYLVAALIFVSLYISFYINMLFFFAVLTYVVIQIFYSIGLKNIPIIDILIIAAGFIIRVYAGAFVIDAHLSVWFLLCVISVALFLASGKRRAELTVLESAGVTRKSLVRYRRELLNSYVTMFGNAAWMSWSLFAFFESPPASLPVWLFLAELSRTTTINKLLMITIPIVIFGIMRYESLIFEGKSEAPEKLLLKDKPLIFSVFLWLITVTLILYGGISVHGV
jgi:4-hydroxybenzoate polyprenyltransferase